MRGEPCFRWTQFEIAQLHRLASERKNSFEISRAMGARSPSAVRVRAFMLGIKLANPRFGEIARDNDITTWSEADKISEWARVPQALADLLVNRVMLAGLNVKELRSDSRAKTLVAFRKAFSVEAKNRGYNSSEIARALNRDHTTIIYAIRSSEGAFICGQPNETYSAAAQLEVKVAA